MGGSQKSDKHKQDDLAKNEGKEERTKEKEMRKAAREKEKRKKMGKNDALSHHLH